MGHFPVCRHDKRCLADPVRVYRKGMRKNVHLSVPNKPIPVTTETFHCVINVMVSQLVVGVYKVTVSENKRVNGARVGPTTCIEESKKTGCPDFSPDGTVLLKSRSFLAGLPPMKAKDLIS